MEAHERRKEILKKLSRSLEPVTGASLAAALGVTRQVIVTDIAILRAKGEAIIATPRGYVKWPEPKSGGVTKLIAVKHSYEETEDELLTMVDCGRRHR